MSNKIYTMKDLQKDANKEKFDVKNAPVKVRNQTTGETFDVADLSYDDETNTVFVICNVPVGETVIAPQATLETEPLEESDETETDAEATA